jgi:3'-phosphoadenosine 5'-phosphosulfate sulfotransferase (PAPS reductase)/FAD synthetase
MGDKVRHILSLSGGKDSAALALYMRGKVPNMEYVFCDTNKELPETYDYLNQIEAYLGTKITRIEAIRGFDHWLTLFEGYLPSIQARWCTSFLKLKPFEDFIGDQPVVNYVGLRADEDRDARISHKENIKIVYPFKEAGIDYAGVQRLLLESGIGMPPYTKWGRSRSGCFFCFYQKAIEWVRLYENHPDLFMLAEEYEEKSVDKKGRFYQWNQEMRLRDLRQPENTRKIKERYEENRKRRWAKRPDKKLVETLAGLDDEEDELKGCAICHL